VVANNHKNVFKKGRNFTFRLNNGVQFHCNRVSVPFLQEKREALVDSFLGYIEGDIRELRAIRSIGGTNRPINQKNLLFVVIAIATMILSCQN
jgi:hypothetical protein